MDGMGELITLDFVLDVLERTMEDGDMRFFKKYEEYVPVGVCLQTDQKLRYWQRKQYLRGEGL